jgi:Zn-dependent protease
MFIYTLISHPIPFLRAVIITIISITIHELAHGIAALSQGDDTPQKTGHLTLNPVVHMGWESIIFLCVAGIAWGQMPINPSKFRSPKIGNILVSVAGPLSNLALAIFSIAMLVIAQQIQIISTDFFDLAARINIVLFMFNLLPIPPLDGFHVLSEFFPEFKLLNNYHFGLFTLMTFILIPNLGEGLRAVADLVIKAFNVI